MQEISPYSAILDHPRYTLRRHRPMARADRAIQFAPFAALEGYEESVAEGARLTTPREALDEDALAALDAAMQSLLERAAERPAVTVTWFLPDTRKDGGRYVTYQGHFRFLDEERGALLMTDGTAIPVDAVCAIRLEEDDERQKMGGDY